MLFDFVFILAIESYLKQLEEEAGPAESRTRRLRHHAAGLLCRGAILLGVLCVFELGLKVRALDSGTFVELIAFDLGVIAYSTFT